MTSHRSIPLLVVLAFSTIAATCAGPQPPVNLKLDDRDRFVPAGRVSIELMPGNAQRRPGALVDLVTGAVGGREASEDRGQGGSGSGGDGAQAGRADEANAHLAQAGDGRAAEPGRATDGKGVGGDAKRVGGEEAQPTFSLVGEFSMIEGRDRRGIPAGRSAQLGVQIPGPAIVDMDVENRRGHLAALTGVRIHDILGLEAIIGLGFDHTELEIRSGAIAARDGNLKPGFLLGGRVSVRPIALVDLHYQYTVNIIRMGSLSSGDTNVQEHQLGGDLNLTRNVALFGGYRWWHFSEEEMDSGSDGDFEIEGPTAGVALKF